MAGSSPVVISSQGLDIEERFSHLLNPIRDLAKNFEVNLANDLQAYLSEMVYQADPSQSSASSFNFAQAALLIQGSTCVYSKKVEYLHKLVYQSIEQLFSTNKKRNQIPSSITASGKDKDLTFDNGAEDYIALDDIEDVRDSLNDNNRRKSVPRTMPRMPLPISPAEASNNVNVEGSNEEADHKGDFKLNTSRVHRGSGALLLSPCNMLLMQEKADEVRDVPLNGEVHAAPCPVADAVNDQDYDDLPVDLLIDDYSDSESFIPPPPPPPVDNPYLKPPKPPEVLPIEKIKLLDPHEEVTPKRPLRKRVVCVKLPPSLVASKKGKKRKADGCPIEVKVEPISPISKFCNSTNFSRVSLFPKNIRQIPNFQLLEDLYWSALKRRRAQLLAHRKEMKDQVHQEELNNNIDGDGIDDDVVDNDMGPNSPFGDDEHEDDLDKGGEDTAREERRKSVLPTDCVEAIDAPIPSSYELLVQNYLKDVNKFCRVTDLGQRVNEWAERIKPLLAREEARASYDIHEYGTRILNCYQDNNRKQTLPFSRIVQGLDRSEASRFFLASLQLANTYNVQISTTGILEEGMDTMELTLLTRKRHHEELQDFRAPSQ